MWAPQGPRPRPAHWTWFVPVGAVSSSESEVGGTDCTGREFDQHQQFKTIMMLQTTTNAPILCGVAANDERLPGDNKRETAGFEPAPLGSADAQSGLVQALGPAALLEQVPKSRAVHAVSTCVQACVVIRRVKGPARQRTELSFDSEPLNRPACDPLTGTTSMLWPILDYIFQTDTLQLLVACTLCVAGTPAREGGPAPPYHGPQRHTHLRQAPTCDWQCCTGSSRACV